MIPPVVQKTKHPKYRTIKIARGKIVKKGGMMGEGVDPNLEQFLSEAKRRGVKVQGWTIDEERDEYKFRVLLPRDETDGMTEGDAPKVFVPETYGGRR